MSKPSKNTSGKSSGKSSAKPSAFRLTENLDAAQLRELSLSIYMEPELGDEEILINSEDAENLIRTTDPDYIPPEYFQSKPAKETQSQKSRLSIGESQKSSKSEESDADLIVLHSNNQEPTSSVQAIPIKSKASKASSVPVGGSKANSVASVGSQASSVPAGRNKANAVDVNSSVAGAANKLFSSVSSAANKINSIALAVVGNKASSVAAEENKDENSVAEIGNVESSGSTAVESSLPASEKSSEVKLTSTENAENSTTSRTSTDKATGGNTIMMDFDFNALISALMPDSEDEPSSDSVEEDRPNWLNYLTTKDSFMDFLVERDNLCETVGCASEPGGCSEQIESTVAAQEPATPAEVRVCDMISSTIGVALQSLTGLVTHLVSVDDLGPYLAYQDLRPYFTTVRRSRSEGTGLHLSLRQMTTVGSSFSQTDIVPTPNAPTPTHEVRNHWNWNEIISAVGFQQINSNEQDPRNLGRRESYYRAILQEQNTVQFNKPVTEDPSDEIIRASIVAITLPDYHDPDIDAPIIREHHETSASSIASTTSDRIRKSHFSLSRPAQTFMTKESLFGDEDNDEIIDTSVLIAEPPSVNNLMSNYHLATDSEDASSVQYEPPEINSISLPQPQIQSTSRSAHTLMTKANQFEEEEYESSTVLAGISRQTRSDTSQSQLGTAATGSGTNGSNKITSVGGSILSTSKTDSDSARTSKPKVIFSEAIELNDGSKSSIDGRPESVTSVGLEVTEAPETNGMEQEIKRRQSKSKHRSSTSTHTRLHKGLGAKEGPGSFFSSNYHLHANVLKPNVEDDVLAAQLQAQKGKSHHGHGSTKKGKGHKSKSKSTTSQLLSNSDNSQSSQSQLSSHSSQLSAHSQSSQKSMSNTGIVDDQAQVQEEASFSADNNSLDLVNPKRSSTEIPAPNYNSHFDVTKSEIFLPFLPSPFEEDDVEEVTEAPAPVEDNLDIAIVPSTSKSNPQTFITQAEIVLQPVAEGEGLEEIPEKVPALEDDNLEIEIAASSSKSQKFISKADITLQPVPEDSGSGNEPEEIAGPSRNVRDEDDDDVPIIHAHSSQGHANVLKISETPKPTPPAKPVSKPSLNRFARTSSSKNSSKKK